MADPYDRSDDRGEEGARRAAERHAEQERRERRGPHEGAQGGDYASGWYGEEAARQGYDIPGPYGRSSEQTSGRGDPGAYDRYDRDSGRRPERMAMDREAERLKGGIERGWRRLSEGVRRAFEEDPRNYPADPRRGGGMFGGEDRRDSMFSHRDEPGDGPGVRPTGPHRGKGPKGYARSDARILEDVNDRLAEDARLDASDIEVKVGAGEVTLDGQVSSRQDKRRAEDLAEQAPGVKHLQNNLRVRQAEGGAGAVTETAPATGGVPGNQDIAGSAGPTRGPLQ